MSATKKADLRAELQRVVNGRPPERVVNGFVQDVRAWKKAMETARKLLANSRASEGDLSSALNALNALRAFDEPRMP